jgi:non-ribosomal peptide synthetase component F
MLAIEMTGGVYCPLSPRDPTHRLQLLLEQIQSRHVLVHYLTKTKFEIHVTSVDIDLLLSGMTNLQTSIDVNQLSNITVTSESIAYIIFTSGSTGIPKAVSTEKY